MLMVYVYGYLDNPETSKDETYKKIMEQLNIFTDHLPSEEDQQLLTKMVSGCYYKHYEAIRAVENDDPSLITPLIIEQQSTIDR